MIQYIIDSAAKNSSNGRGSWILHLKEKQTLRKSGEPTIFDWDTTSTLKIHFHRFASAIRPMDNDGLVVAFKPVCDGVMDGLCQQFNQKFNDGDQSRFFFVYSQSKAPIPAFADTILVTIDLLLEATPYSSVVMRWGVTPELIDRDSLIATLGDMRALRIDEITREISTSRQGTKKVAALQKDLKKKQKAIGACVAEFVFA